MFVCWHGKSTKSAVSSEDEKSDGVILLLLALDLSTFLAHIKQDFELFYSIRHNFNTFFGFVILSYLLSRMNQEVFISRARTNFGNDIHKDKQTL